MHSLPAVQQIIDRLYCTCISTSFFSLCNTVFAYTLLKPAILTSLSHTVAFLHTPAIMPCLMQGLKPFALVDRMKYLRKTHNNTCIVMKREGANSHVSPSNDSTPRVYWCLMSLWSFYRVEFFSSREVREGSSNSPFLTRNREGNKLSNCTICFFHQVIDLNRAWEEWLNWGTDVGNKRVEGTSANERWPPPASQMFPRIKRSFVLPTSQRFIDSGFFFPDRLWRTLGNFFSFQCSLSVFESLLMRVKLRFPPTSRESKKSKLIHVVCFRVSVYVPSALFTKESWLMIGFSQLGARYVCREEMSSSGI